MFKNIRRNPVFWAIICVLLQILVSVLFSSHMATVVASAVLMIAALSIWRLEKYQKQLPINRYSMVFAVVAIALMVANLWFYANIYAKFNLG